jgi:hypothetical protein
MSRPSVFTPPVVATPLRPGAANLRVVWATVRASLLRYASNPIMMLRSPIVPALMLVSFHLVYQVSGQDEVDGVDAMSFLVVGMLGTLAWSSTVWGSGNALQAESYYGTISAVVAAPQSLAAVITGYGLANMIFGLPALAVCIGTGYAFGAETMIYDPARCRDLTPGALRLLSVHRPRVRWRVHPVAAVQRLVELPAGTYLSAGRLLRPA